MFLYLEGDLFCGYVYLLRRNPVDIISTQKIKDFIIQPETDDVIAKLHVEGSGELIPHHSPPTLEEEKIITLSSGRIDIFQKIFNLQQLRLEADNLWISRYMQQIDQLPDCF